MSTTPSNRARPSWRYYDVQTTNATACFICGMHDHSFDQPCPRELCFKCCQFGHRFADCKAKERYIPRICYQCGSTDHTTEDCAGDIDNIVDLSKVRCSNCYTFGHINCISESKPTSTSRQCGNCGANDHTFYDCFKPRMELNVNADYRKTNRHSSQPICHNCGKFGHIKSECFQSSRQSESSPTKRYPKKRKFSDNFSEPQSERKPKKQKQGKESTKKESGKTKSKKKDRRKTV